MRFTMEVESGNDAVDVDGVAKMVEKVAEKIKEGEFTHHTQSVKDANGNRVGSWKLETGNF